MTAVPRIGTVVSIADGALAELLGAALDLAWIDLEHGALGPRDVPPLAIALRAADCQAHVRLPGWDSEALGPVLDAGVEGVVVPGIESAAEAGALVRRLRYPPAGTRGFGPRRAGGYGRRMDQLGRVSCTVQVESPKAVDAAAAIAAVNGVDAVVVGCADLRLRLGSSEDSALPAAVKRAATAVRAAGAEFGVAGAGRQESLVSLVAEPPDLVVHDVDVRVYARAIDAAVAEVRAAFPGTTRAQAGGGA